jgi:electron transport complex protein RnfG
MIEQQSNKNSAFSLPIKKNSQILAIFAIACTALVGLVNELTKDKIKVQAQQQLLSTLNSIIEPSSYDNDITQDCVTLSSTEPNYSKSHKKVQTAYIARKNNEVVAIAMTSTAPDGYNGSIELIVAINMDNSLSGVRVLKHQETPGLGDKVELRKSDWITNFNDKKVLSEQDNRWAVAKDGGIFDQFTGATITPRAVIKAVRKTALYFKDNKESLFDRPNSCLINEQSPQVNASVENEVSDEH